MVGKFLSSCILQLAGWEIVGSYPHHIRKGIIVVAPHTSNWDFALGVATRAIQQFPSYFLIKDDWIQLPIIGWIVTQLGGVGVDRSGKSKKSTSEQIINYFNTREEFVITITPEGTRKYNPDWRTGFWYIAKEAEVPLIPASFDYEKKQVIWQEPFYVSEQKEEDISKLKAMFRQYKGRFPEQGVR